MKTFHVYILLPTRLRTSRLAAERASVVVLPLVLKAVKILEELSNSIIMKPGKPIAECRR